MIDLHVHSTYSDGTKTPSQLVVLAKKVGIHTFALTDHDTVKGVKEAIEEGKTHNIAVIPGIEFSVYYMDREIHIVGLYIDPQNDWLEQKMRILCAARVERNDKIIQKLNALGIPLTIDDVQENLSQDLITRAHIATALFHKQYVKTRKEAFEKYLDQGKPAFVNRDYFSPQECIALIQKCGGVSILAHPTLYHLTEGQIEKLASDLKNMGLDGIEGIYSTFTYKDTVMIQRLAKGLGLILSGGSDFHGDNKPDLQMGVGYGRLYVPDKILPPIQTLAEERKGSGR